MGLTRCSLGTGCGTEARVEDWWACTEGKLTYLGPNTRSLSSSWAGRLDVAWEEMKSGDHRHWPIYRILKICSHNSE